MSKCHYKSRNHKTSFILLASLSSGFFLISAPLSAITLHQAATIARDSGFTAQELADAPIAAYPLLPHSSSPQQAEAPPEKWRMFDPNAMPESNGFWIDAEALFWKSNVGSLDYGVTSKSPTQIKDGKVKHPHFSWDYGVRIGLGYKLPHDKWDVLLTYTYVHGNAQGHAGGKGNVVFPTWATNFGSLFPFYASKAEAHWKAHLNMGDAELGRNCFVSKWLTIRPFIGVRGLWIDQNYHVDYKGGTIAPVGTDKARLDTDFWGAGLRFGADTLWGLGRGFSIYGNGSASLLSGHFKVKETEKITVIDLRVLNAKRSVDTAIVTADLALGLQWDYMLSKDRYHFGVKFGWELDMFFDQNQLFNFGNNTNFRSQNDDLSFQGLTLGVRFDF